MDVQWQWLGRAMLSNYAHVMAAFFAICMALPIPAAAGAILLPSGSILTLPQVAEASFDVFPTVAFKRRPFMGTDVTDDVVFSGTLTSIVARRPDDTLIFAYYAVNATSSAVSVQAFSVSGFAGFTTEVAMADGFNRTPFVLASGASRSPDGDTLRFEYGTGSNYGPLLPGDEFRALAIYTDATTFSERQALFESDGAQGFGSSYAPVSVPEPASWSTLAIGLLALLCLGSTKSRGS